MLDTHARKWVQPIIDHTARWFLTKDWTPDRVTWLAFAVGISSVIWIVWDWPLVAVLLLWISGYLDAVDGTMARLSGKSSAWGTLLDITFDRLVELAVILAIAVMMPHAVFHLLVLTASIVFSMTVFLTVGALSEKKGMKTFYYQAGLAERTEGFILLSLMLLFPKWLLWTTTFFIVVETWTGLQRMLEARKILR